MNEYPIRWNTPQLSHPHTPGGVESLGEPDSEPAQALLARLEDARDEYDQAAADFLNALRRLSHLPLSDREKQELLRQARQREEAAFTRYKQLLDDIAYAGELAS